MVTHFGAEKSPVFFFLSCIIKFYSQIKLFKKKKVFSCSFKPCTVLFYSCSLLNLIGSVFF